MQLIRQVVAVIIREKNSSSAPAITAPAILVAPKVIARSISEVRIVPKIPVRSTGSTVHTHLTVWEAAIRVMPSIATAMPKVTHKNTGVRVIVAEYTRNVVMIPMIILATTASVVQLVLQQQFVLDIKFTSVTIYEKIRRGATKFNKKIDRFFKYDIIIVCRKNKNAL